MPETELWRRRAETYNVELLVGETWVQHNQLPIADIQLATRTAEQQAREAGVKGTRVCSVVTNVRYLEVATFDPPPPIITKVIKGFTPTGNTHACRLCGTQQPVAEDANGAKWLFCAACKRQSPM